MNKISLGAIREIFQRGDNIVQYLKKNRDDLSTLEMILISYDFQSGTYISYTNKHKLFNEKYTSALAKVINGLNVKYQSLLEVGVGEATTLANVVGKLSKKPKFIFGFDISWSRIKYALKYLRAKEINNSFVFTGDLFNIPLADDSIDIVYTSHSIEPNGGREKEALQELIRVTNKYLVLLEPAYELAQAAARKRMEQHGYIKNLHNTAIKLGMNIVEYRLFDVIGNSLNPTGLLIIKKESKRISAVKNPLVCPITKTPLRLIRGSYFSKESMLVYPVIDNVPCLLSDNAVIATHYGKS